MRFGRTAMMTLFASALNVCPALAQSLMVGGGVETSTQRFSGGPTPNRLGGTTGGLTVLGGIGLGPLVVRAEGSSDGAISDVETLSLTVDGRPLTIRSTLAHDRHAVAALGGYTRELTTRVMVAGVGGVSFVTVHRRFTTNAGQQLLVNPSTVPSGATRSTQVDRFAAWSVGADVFVRAKRNLRMLAGVRVEPMKLEPDFSGRSVRVLGGIVWVR